MLKWDLDSPVPFHADGHTVHDFEKRFALEDKGIVPCDRKFRWKMLAAVQEWTTAKYTPEKKNVIGDVQYETIRNKLFQVRKNKAYTER